MNKEEIMLHINKFKFGLEEKRNLKSITKKKIDDINFNLIRFPFGKISKKETEILATIGPKSCSINSIYNISKFTNCFRINGSHNSLEWHIKISKRIKEICPESFILLDIPGLKPRTSNLKDIQIKKNQMVKFVFGKQDNEEGVLSIETTKPLPKIKNRVQEFSVSDGLFKFQYIKNNNNFIQGISKNTFKLKPKKGLNIPNSFYDDTLQERLYLEFIRKAKKVQFDGLGLSFIQNGEILKKIRNILKDKFLVSKIENLYGLNNASEISKNSDLIMIDRGDLLAEVGEVNLYKAICEISTQAHHFKKPLIMATENLESMQKRLQPSKSEIIALEHSINLGSDIIMLSDETATSPLFMNTLEWLYNFLKQ